MDGLAVGAVCYRAELEAAAAACSSVAGVSAGGVLSCEAPTITSGLMSYTLVTEGATRTTRAATMQLQPCEPFDIEEYGPTIAAWFLAGVLVLCVRSVYSKVFNRESY